MRPGTYSRPADPMPQARPRLAPFAVVQNGPFGPSVDVGHPVLPGRGRAVDEEVGGEPAEVDVAIGRDHLVAHTRSLLRVCKISSRTNPTRSAGAPPSTARHLDGARRMRAGATMVGARRRAVLPREFYTRAGVLAVARDLLGQRLVVPAADGTRVAGTIVETEAYRGPADRASHAYGGRRTRRTETMYSRRRHRLRLLRLRHAPSVQRGHRRRGRPARRPRPRARARRGPGAHARAPSHGVRPRADERAGQALPGARHRSRARRRRPPRAARVDRARRAASTARGDRPRPARRRRLRGAMGGDAVALLDQGQSLRESPARLRVSGRSG